MDKRSSDLNLHQRLEFIVKDMIEKGINLKDALRETEKIFYEQVARRHDGNLCPACPPIGCHPNAI